MGIFSFFKSKAKAPSPSNPYTELMDSIQGLRDQFKKDNKLGFVADQVVIRKGSGNFDVDCNLRMENGRVMKMGYSLEESAKVYLPKRVLEELEARGIALIEQTEW